MPNSKTDPITSYNGSSLLDLEGFVFTKASPTNLAVCSEHSLHSNLDSRYCNLDSRF